MKRMIWIVILALILCGCSNDQEQVAVVFEDSATFPTEAITEFPMIDPREGTSAYRSYEELYADFGKIYSVLTENRDYILSLSDYAAGENYPLCPKSNCRHDSDECGAWFPFDGGQPEFLHYDGSYLYFFHRGDMTLHKQNLDGSGREMVADLSEVVFSVNTVLYEQDTAWLLCELMTMNENTSEIAIRKTIVKLDLTNGKWAELPYTFEGDMTNVELHGKYGNELLLRYTYSVGSVQWKNMEDSRSVIFLMNVNTGAITRLTEYEFTYVSSAKCPGYLIYCVFDPNSEYKFPYRSEEMSAFTGAIQIFDLTERVCYTMKSDCLTWEFSIRDANLFYCEPGEDGNTLAGKIRNLKTGEVSDWKFFDAEPPLRWLAETETGDYFIVMEGDTICRILKEDYYAGSRNVIPIP